MIENQLCSKLKPVEVSDDCHENSDTRIYLTLLSEMVWSFIR